MNNWTESLLVGIFGSLIAAVIYDILKSSIRWLPGVLDRIIANTEVPKPENIEELYPPENQRYENITTVKLHLFNILFYAITFFILYTCHRAPLLFKGGFFGNKDVYLDTARFIGQYLPNISITNEHFQKPFVISTLIMYLPTLYLANIFGVPFIVIINKFYKPTIYLWRRLQIFIFSIFALIQAGLIVYLFYEKSFRESLITPFVAAFMILAIALGNQDRK